MPTIFKDKVVVNNTIFNDVASKPTGAVKFGVDILDGWDDTGETEITLTSRGSNVDGDEINEFQPMRSRHIFVGGYVYAETRADAETLADIIVRDAFPRSTELQLTRYEPIPKFMRVWRGAGKIEMKRQVGGLGFRFLVPLVAPDPLKYDADPQADSYGTAGVAGQSTTGFVFPLTFPLVFTNIEGADTVQSSVVVRNRGTADTRAIITLTGPLLKGGWRVTNETVGADLRFDVGLTATDTLVIDFREEEALLNGYPITTTITGDFWSVVPGPNVIKLYGDYDPAATIAASILSAWE